MTLPVTSEAWSSIPMRKVEIGSTPEAPLAACASRRAEQPDHDRLLDMEAILGLVEDDRLRSVDHSVGDLLATMRRKAVHDEYPRARVRHESLVHLIGPEGLATGLGFGLLPHAR